ncbi:hypothetical protein T492DRAFT_295737 [Pavlovales sp. CCMP2436]|nr:hypothetical protein T492DRAFT_295737 [Pavlovales sp. CCMP2436]
MLMDSGSTACQQMPPSSSGRACSTSGVSPKPTTGVCTGTVCRCTAKKRHAQLKPLTQAWRTSDLETGRACSCPARRRATRTPGSRIRLEPLGTSVGLTLRFASGRIHDSAARSCTRSNRCALGRATRFLCSLQLARAPSKSRQSGCGAPCGPSSDTALSCSVTMRPSARPPVHLRSPSTRRRRRGPRAGRSGPPMGPSGPPSCSSAGRVRALHRRTLLRCDVGAAR